MENINEIQKILKELLLKVEDQNEYFYNPQRFNIQERKVGIFYKEYAINKSNSDLLKYTETNDGEIQFRMNMDLYIYFSPLLKSLGVEIEFGKKIIKQVSDQQTALSYKASFNDNEFYGRYTTYGAFPIVVKDIINLIENKEITKIYEEQVLQLEQEKNKKGYKK